MLGEVSKVTRYFQKCVVETLDYSIPKNGCEEKGAALKSRYDPNPTFGIFRVSLVEFKVEVVGRLIATSLLMLLFYDF